MSVLPRENLSGSADTQLAALRADMHIEEIKARERSRRAMESFMMAQHSKNTFIPGESFPQTLRSDTTYTSMARRTDARSEDPLYFSDDGFFEFFENHAGAGFVVKRSRDAGNRILTPGMRVILVENDDMGTKKEVVVNYSSMTDGKPSGAVVLRDLLPAEKIKK